MGHPAKIAEYKCYENKVLHTTHVPFINKESSAIALLSH
jgi:hypothetical protein